MFMQGVVMGGIVGVNRGQRKKGKECKREIDKYSAKEGRNRREGRRREKRKKGEGGGKEGRKLTRSLM